MAQFYSVHQDGAVAAVLPTWKEAAALADLLASAWRFSDGSALGGGPNFWVEATKATTLTSRADLQFLELDNRRQAGYAWRAFEVVLQCSR